MAAAASLSPLLFISWAPTLSVMTADCFRSMSCASADDVCRSTSSPTTLTVSENLLMVRPTSAVMVRSAPVVTVKERSW